MHDQVLGTTDVEHLDDLGARQDLFDKGATAIAAVRLQLHEHDHLKGQAEGLGVHASAEPGQHPGLCQALYPGERRRRCQPHPVGQLAVGESRVILEQVDDLVVDRVECHRVLKVVRAPPESRRTAASTQCEPPSNQRRTTGPKPPTGVRAAP